MMKPLTFGSVLGLVVCGALVHGAATQRWNVLAPDGARTDALHALEVKISDFAQ